MCRDDHLIHKEWRILPCMRIALLITVLLVFAGSALAAGQQQPCPSPVTTLILNKGEYSPMPGAVFELTNYASHMVAQGKKSPLCFTRVNEIEHANVFIKADSLSKMFDRKLQQSSSKVTEMHIEIKEGEVHLKGKTHKGIDIPFDIQGTVSTDGKHLLLKTKHIEAKGLPVKGLLNMIGVHLASLMQSEHVDGVQARGDTLIFDPEKIAHVRGQITDIKVNAGGLAISFAEPAHKQQSARK
jgi:hypothetical protein